MEEKSKLKKATFTLPESLLEKLRAYVENQTIPSANNAVREALEKYVANLEKEAFAKEMAEAANDPDFIRDIEELDRDFQYADAETARVIPKW